LAGLPLPFNPIQILWVNIIMDGPPAIALGLDPPRRDVMQARPRARGDSILSGRGLARLVGTGMVMATATLGVLVWALDHGPRDWALTLAFTTFVLCQLFNALNVRTETASAFAGHLFTNWRLWAALTAVLGLQILATRWGPAQQVFHTATLSAVDWALAACVASSILWAEEIRKAWLRRARRASLAATARGS
jgi:Ca2+-transporting ATPase